VILFDEEGRMAMRSDPLAADEISYTPEIKQVLASGKPAEAVREIGGMQVFSIVMPVQLAPARSGRDPAIDVVRAGRNRAIAARYHHHHAGPPAAGRPPGTDQIIRTVFIALLSLLTAFFGFFFGVALI
jgi:hypothetical protein